MIALISLIVGIGTLLIGIPSVISFRTQSKDNKRAKKRDICKALLTGKNWNNLGVDIHPCGAISIEIERAEQLSGEIAGTITNCDSSISELKLITFDFFGTIDHKGRATITLQTSFAPTMNVGLAQIKYSLEKNTLDYSYLHAHEHNPTASNELGLPRFTSYALKGR